MKYLSIFIRVALLALGQSLDCHSASEVSLMDMGKSVNVEPQQSTAKQKQCAYFLGYTVCTHSINGQSHVAFQDLAKPLCRQDWLIYCMGRYLKKWNKIISWCYICILHNITRFKVVKNCPLKLYETTEVSLEKISDVCLNIKVKVDESCSSNL